MLTSARFLLFCHMQNLPVLHYSYTHPADTNTQIIPHFSNNSNITSEVKYSIKIGEKKQAEQGSDDDAYSKNIC